MHLFRLLPSQVWMFNMLLLMTTEENRYLQNLGTPKAKLI
uniref:Uncharacterized protein n=1 Tax=Rhizophora mucronata TaxID=61149 RepID=A0A2P2P798_RHIMU